jgi:hypothetical protein
MWAVSRKGRLLRNIYGMYIMFDKKLDAVNFADPDGKAVKVTLTITPKDKP